MTPADPSRAAGLLHRLLSRLTVGSHPATGDADPTGRKNLLLLIQLRWIAVVGQIVTIAIVSAALRPNLPYVVMAGVLAALVALNIGSLVRLRRGGTILNGELFGALIFDVLALTAQLYLSGGATNPFVFLYLLQVTLAAVLLEAWSTWVLVGLTGLCFTLLTLIYHPLDLPGQTTADLFGLHIAGMLICFALDAALLVVFVTRVHRNLLERDAHLADLRQQAAEEDHIVRMGLLASGAAHELGTPLATLSVILGDWRRMPALTADPELAQEIDSMQAEVARCKAIVTGILLSAGEARGESAGVTTLHTFLDSLVADWRAARSVGNVGYETVLGDDIPIAYDTTLKQVICNVLDNAHEASPQWIGVAAIRSEATLTFTVTDAGPGFAPGMLENLGKPYQSTKGRRGGGLGLFLVVNVVRKLGGQVTARNRQHGGAVVAIELPLATLAIEEGTAHE